VEKLATGFYHVTVHFGFAEKPDLPAALKMNIKEVGFDAGDASFFLGREVPVPSLRPEVPIWQEYLYAFMTRNAVRAPDYFLIPLSLKLSSLGPKSSCKPDCSFETVGRAWTCLIGTGMHLKTGRTRSSCSPN
jgi:K+ transporter